ncbi:hypothetical protein A3K93_04060 [Acinetobacter sp. NCu2D-2]|uniref:Lnb N-terminal periplasmic domain-containing protein n=1 Tax=Acinetobacter sp. NCu2D-2 TaxID=1608473 RepID=UPI0007CDA94B|nr:DUF4105 domain-containing protein [Acinetobacter sp. NCu2D-2]ANF81446.1 hypothetical protein A3K93_04060 [Acinetobacter sp. NCu2D-2]
MKLKTIFFFSFLFHSSILSASTTLGEFYQDKAVQLQLANDPTWQRLLYANSNKNSEVDYAGFFYAEQGKHDLTQELKQNITALFEQHEDNKSIQCKFPARSEFLIQKLNITQSDLPEVSCTEFDEWIGQIKPYKATLIYATDFMGNPSSMFGHTLLRLDPKNLKELNLVSYAVNYAATVSDEQSWSYAWKGLTGQYPGEYSLMPYYRKVKEYGDFESRDLWEYELTLTEQETRFLVKHIWELKHVQFPYYFINDNCAYRLLGLIDLVRPQANLQRRFKASAIPIETIKAIRDEHLIETAEYRPALETQLNAQAKQHGYALAKHAHVLTQQERSEFANFLQKFNVQQQARILEMAYDDLYLQLLSRKVEAKVAEPKLRQLLILRSQIDLDKQRATVSLPKVDPVDSHHARHISLGVGKVQGEDVITLGHRQAYHDLIDPQGGYRIGTQLKLLDGQLQYRDDQLKLESFNVLSVNSYNPITPFKTPLSWGFNLGWKQEAQHQGHFSETEQHGVFNLNTQFGFSAVNTELEHLCYAQIQNHLQAGKNLDKGWRVGLGPTLGCQNIWTDRINSLVQIELPYWSDRHVWQMNIGSAVQYSLNAQNSLQLSWNYQQSKHENWQQIAVNLLHYF